MSSTRVEFCRSTWLTPSFTAARNFSYYEVRRATRKPALA